MLRMELRIDGDLAAAAIRLFTMWAQHAAYPGWRFVWGLVAGASVHLAITCPRWRRLPRRDRDASLDMLSRDSRLTEVTVNGRVLIHQTVVRRLLGRRPAIGLD